MVRTVRMSSEAGDISYAGYSFGNVADNWVEEHPQDIPRDKGKRQRHVPQPKSPIIVPRAERIDSGITLL